MNLLNRDFRQMKIAGQHTPFWGGQDGRFLQYISNQNLIKAIMESMDVKDRTARSYIKFMKDNEIIEKNPSNALEYSLITLPF